MAKTEGQKAALLYTKDYLERNSGPDHPVSAQEMISYLKTKEITCDRRTIYSHVRALKEYGMDILIKRGAKGGFYLLSSQFEVPELKLLIDAVQSARFLTPRKSHELTRKLLSFANRYDENLLNRQMMVTGRAKSMNESIYYNLDAIQEAIAQEKKITFQYFEWDVNHNQRLREGPHEASPYALCVDSDNYYLLAHTHKHGVTHYRVDRMLRIRTIDVRRDDCPELTGAALRNYSKKMFQMYTGKTVEVRLRMANKLAGVVFDRFGENTMLIPDGDSHFIFRADVAISPMFLSWVIGFGKEAQIISPDEVRLKCRDLCMEAAAQCENLNK